MNETGSGTSSREKTAKELGKVGLPRPLSELSRMKWDVIIVGAGHNGLVCASYLAKAGKKVIVVEARERVGGACTLEETWPGVKVSPCAYVVGLLHNRVIHELDMVGYGFSWTPASGGMFVPFADGSSVQMVNDEKLCEAEIERFSPRDVKGWQAMRDVKRRLRDKLRPEGNDDLWLDPNVTREKLEYRLKGDDDAKKLLLEWSMVEYVEKYLQDERLQMAYLGQGVIGTNASPFDKGTASINFHHASGRLDGLPGTWGYVKGGMGMVSFILCDIARALGVAVAAGVAVSRIHPGEGVELEGGERLNAPIIISNADPKMTLRLLDQAADAKWKAQVESIPMTGCTAKINLALSELPNFLAKPGTATSPHFGQINTPLTKDEWKESFAAAQRGDVSDRVWTELYFQTAFDPTVAPPGVHTMSVFAQYVPYQFAQGDWDSNRERVETKILNSIGRFCSNFPQVVLHKETLGPPDIEKRVGLTGGHIFQGECLPDHMWDKRLRAKTPMKGIYLCGAGTHPGGSVIGANGRNAAMEVLRSLVTTPQRIT
jgi:phytoene dehydrogenase-like protein